MVAHICNSSIQMTEAGGWLQGEPGLQSEILKDLKKNHFLKKKLKNEREWYGQVFVCKVCLWMPGRE